MYERSGFCTLLKISSVLRSIKVRCKFLWVVRCNGNLCVTCELLDDRSEEETGNHLRRHNDVFVMSRYRPVLPRSPFSCLVIITGTEMNFTIIKQVVPKNRY